MSYLIQEKDDSIMILNLMNGIFCIYIEENTILQINLKNEGMPEIREINLNGIILFFILKLI